MPAIAKAKKSPNQSNRIGQSLTCFTPSELSVTIVRKMLKVNEVTTIVIPQPAANKGMPATAPMPDAAIAIPYNISETLQKRPNDMASHRTGTPLENMKGRTPVISGHRGRIGRPRTSTSIGLPVRRDFSRARPYSLSRSSCSICRRISGDIAEGRAVGAAAGSSMGTSISLTTDGLALFGFFGAGTT
jgi:hypothetical protein